MKTKSNTNFRNIIYTALFAAMICVAIMVIKFPIPGRGYYHTGDAFIYLAAVCLPFPYGIIAAAIGGAFADLFLGYHIYILPTFIIKAFMAMCFVGKTEKIVCTKNIIGIFLASIVLIVGYYLAEVAILLLASEGGSIVELTGAIGEIPGNIVQALSSGIIFVAIATAMDRISLRQKLFKIY